MLSNYCNKKNIHFYFSALENESRILRAIECLDQTNLFSKIEVIGYTTNANILPLKTRLSASSSFLRLPLSSKLPKSLNFLLWNILLFKKYVFTSVSCINCHSLSCLPIAVLLKFFTRSKLVYDTHELETETNLMKGRKKIVFKLIEKLLISYCDRHIFVSKSIQAWYKSKYHIDNSLVIYNLPKKVEIPKNQYLRNLFGIDPDKIILIYQGVLANGRGIDLLLEAFSNPYLSDYALVFLGYGALKDKCEYYSSIFPNIFFHEKVPPEKLLQISSSADFGLSLIQPSCLSYQYCMPNKLFEYLVAGLPVIVSPVIELRQFVNEYNVGLVAKSLSIDDIISSVRKCSNSSKLTYKANIDAVLEKFSFDKQFASYAMAHNDILEKVSNLSNES